MESRSDILARFRAQIAAGQPIIGGGAGTGITAKSAEAGGIDLLVIYNSGRFRMAGRGSLSGVLAYGDANAIVMDMAHEVLPVVKKVRCWLELTAPILSASCRISSNKSKKLVLLEFRISRQSASLMAYFAPI